MYGRLDAEYITHGEGLSVFSADRFFARGVADVLMGSTGVKASLRYKAMDVLHFPSLRYLLAWSELPVLPNNITLILGNHQVCRVLADIFSPCHIQVMEDRLPPSALTKAVVNAVNQCVLAMPAPPKVVWLSAEEVSFMWAFISARSLSGDAKRNSQLKRQVMKKLATDSTIGLLIRFRLMFRLSGQKLLLRGRMRRSGPGPVRWEYRKKQTEHAHIAEVMI